MEQIPVTGIVMATHIEAAPFIDQMMFTPVGRKPFPVYKFRSAYLVLSGIGKTNAAAATSYLITKYNPGIMYNIGAAGATTGAYGLGDILHIGSVIEYDRPPITGSSIRHLRPDILPGYATAALATRDIPVVSSDDRRKVGELAPLADMEGAAFVQACRIFGVRNYLFKIVTDTPSHSVDREIVENIRLTRDNLYRFFTDNFLS